MSRSVYSGGASAGSGSTALGDGGERKASKRVPRRALASPLVEALLLLFLADLDLCFAAAAPGLISSHAGLEELCALREVQGEHNHEQMFSTGKLATTLRRT